MIEYQRINTLFGSCLLAERVYRENGKEKRNPVFLEFEQQPEGGETALQRLLRRYERKEELRAAKEAEMGLSSRYTLEGLLDTAAFGWSELEVQGTAFQLAVWKALFEVPSGEIISYSQLAQRAGYGNAVRAVASVVASNPISLIIPCHRIVRKEVFSVPDGKKITDYGNYRWGREVKRGLIEWERGLRDGNRCIFQTNESK